MDDKFTRDLMAGVTVRKTWEEGEAMLIVRVSKVED